MLCSARVRHSTGSDSGHVQHGGHDVGQGGSRPGPREQPSGAAAAPQSARSSKMRHRWPGAVPYGLPTAASASRSRPARAEQMIRSNPRCRIHAPSLPPVRQRLAQATAGIAALLAQAGSSRTTLDFPVTDLPVGRTRFTSANVQQQLPTLRRSRQRGQVGNRMGAGAERTAWLAAPLRRRDAAKASSGRAVQCASRLFEVRCPGQAAGLAAWPVGDLDAQITFACVPFAR
jgi:hypothetical protein